MGEVLKISPIRARRISFMALAPLCLILAGCATPDGARVSGDVFDPYEENNRQTHELNRALDKALVRPVGVGYTAIVPDDLEGCSTTYQKFCKLCLGDLPLACSRPEKKSKF